QGLCLILLGCLGGPRLSVRPGECLDLPRPETPLGEGLRRPALLVAAATVLAAGLRLYGLGSDLWVDEITTVLAYQNTSPFHVLTAYTSSNNHLLNTLLMKASVSALGVTEWAVRLPAVLLGIACIPAQYGLARLALGRRESVLAALLLAVSQHHIFFSQNA